MLTDREIVAAMQEANPLPEPHLLPDDAAGFDILLEKISERRVPMLSTPETRTEELEAIPAPTTWRRKPLAVLASFIAIMVAVGIGALIFRDGGSDIATVVPSSTLPPTTAPAAAAPSTIAPAPGFTPGVFVTYGAEQGVPDECAHSIEFAGTDVYLAGACGLLHFDGVAWTHLAELPYPNYFIDLAAAPDGTVWVANIDTNVLQWTGQELVEYDLRASEIEVTPDGTVWAVQEARWEDAAAEIDKVEALRRFDGSEWILVNEAVEYQGSLETGPDGTLWARETQYEDGSAYSVLKSHDGTSWLTHEIPSGLYLGSGFGFAADGSLILPISNDAQSLVLAVQKGEDWTTHTLHEPTLEEFEIPMVISPSPMNEPLEHLGLRALTIAPDGTYWAVSGNGYGAFSFDGDEWTRYTTEDGLASNQLFFIEIGPDGSLWFGTEDAGVTRYMPKQ